MRRIILAVILTVISLISTVPGQAAQDLDKNVAQLENKVAKKFAKTFCNASGFGISEEGSLKFAIGETEVEFAKNPLTDSLNLQAVKNKILDGLADTCNYYEFDINDLDDLKFTS
ncbi:MULTISPECIES: hypothetical protein [Prochlorococcus]|uniref:hypothetical protein n=1 Tax=Prochlorococcus TaxID=1218 RepID=UPI0005339B28|nr:MULTISPECIES: hypothetical protein [Prochlorococcus]KGG12797.1 putative S1 RNA binding domain-containing protein [Prochlorococcus sp. MIT 0601]